MNDDVQKYYKLVSNGKNARNSIFNDFKRGYSNMKIQVVVVLRCTGTRQSKQDLHTHTHTQHTIVAHDAHTHIIID